MHKSMVANLNKFDKVKVFLLDKLRSKSYSIGISCHSKINRICLPTIEAKNEAQQ